MGRREPRTANYGHIPLSEDCKLRTCPAVGMFLKLRTCPPVGTFRLRTCPSVGINSSAVMLVPSIPGGAGRTRAWAGHGRGPDTGAGRTRARAGHGRGPDTGREMERSSD